MSDDRPTEDQLRLAARRGSGRLSRALSIVLLARELDRMDRIRDFLDNHDDTINSPT